MFLLLLIYICNLISGEKDKEYGDKTKHKYQKLLGDKLYNNVMRLHKADKEMH